MANQEPNNDKDIRLARQIEQSNTEGKPLTESDPVLSALKSYKSQKKGELKQSESDRQDVWNRIEQATRTSRKTNRLSLVSSPVLRWAAAAVLLIGITIGVFYTEMFQQPALLAETGASIDVVTLADGSTITLRPNSKLFAIEQEQQNQAYKLEGEGFFDITPSDTRTFSVETSSGKVSVLGTRFNMSSWGDQLQVYLEEGSVQVKALEHDHTIILDPGESAVVTSSTDRPELQNISAEEVSDWMNQELVFKEKPASQVISELEQQFNISVSLPADAAGQLLTGRLSLADRETAFDDLEIVLNGTFVRTEAQNYRFETN